MDLKKPQVWQINDEDGEVRVIEKSFYDSAVKELERLRELIEGKTGYIASQRDLLAELEELGAENAKLRQALLPRPPG